MLYLEGQNRQLKKKQKKKEKKKQHVSYVINIIFSISCYLFYLNAEALQQ